MMNRDPRLERYLTTLESALKPFPVGDRAEIVTEIKSHVLSALERDPQASVDSILAALGEPELVANRYLLERGLKPTKPPISPIVKWIVIGFLGTIAMLLIFAGFLITRFSPIVHVDESGEKVELLGGSIKVDGDRVSIKGIVDDFNASYRGDVTMKENDSVLVNFNNGRVEIGTSDDSKVTWECKTSGGTGSLDPKSEGGALNLDLSKFSGVRCDIHVPKSVKLAVKGMNGRISVEDADFDVDLDLARGRVDFDAKDGVAYKYETKVDMGRTDSFESSNDPKARLAKIHVGAGRIGHDD